MPASQPIDPQSALIAEQLSHSIDLLRAEIDQLKSAQEYSAQLAGQRLAAVEESARDHETRIRLLTDGVTQFKVWSGLVSGGSSLVSLVALLRVWIAP
jgi:hypothetical protein